MRLPQRVSLGLWIALLAIPATADAQVIPVNFLELVAAADSIVTTSLRAASCSSSSEPGNLLKVLVV